MHLDYAHSINVPSTVQLSCSGLIMILTLKGRTNKGKNRIREHGEVWEVLEWESPTSKHDQVCKNRRGTVVDRRF